MEVERRKRRALETSQKNEALAQRRYMEVSERLVRVELENTDNTMRREQKQRTRPIMEEQEDMRHQHSRDGGSFKVIRRTPQGNPLD